MDIKEAVLAGFKELILPELNRVKEDTQGMKEILLLTNKKLDDLNMHLANRSRDTHEANKRIDEQSGEANNHIDENDKGIEQHIHELRRELKEGIFQLLNSNTARIDDINQRLDRLCEGIARSGGYDALERRVTYLEQEVSEIKLKLGDRESAESWESAKYKDN